MSKPETKKTEKKLRDFQQRRDWLYSKTGKDSFFWMHMVQTCIEKNSVPITRGKWKGHGRTDVVGFLGLLSKCVWTSRPSFKKEAYDENMYMAAVLGYILSVWFVLVQTAKTQDPRRPIELRMKGLRRLPEYQSAMTFDMCDEFLKYSIFGGQEHFEPPYTKNATNGTFV